MWLVCWTVVAALVGSKRSGPSTSFPTRHRLLARWKVGRFDIILRNTGPKMVSLKRAVIRVNELRNQCGKRGGGGGGGGGGSQRSWFAMSYLICPRCWLKSYYIWSPKKSNRVRKRVGRKCIAIFLECSRQNSQSEYTTMVKEDFNVTIFFFWVINAQ